MKTLLMLALFATAAANAGPPDAFLSNLELLCGKAFEGRLVASPDGDMEGERLLMHVRECSGERIRIPFVVGDNLSRTWVLTRVGERFELKHDHRDRDGERFVYYVRRLATGRYYHVEFDLAEPVDPPPAPWGWAD